VMVMVMVMVMKVAKDSTKEGERQIEAGIRGEECFKVISRM
jgi:hypothetical protein